MKKKDKLIYKEIPESEIVDGELVLHFDATEATSDWLRYGRLRKQNTAESKAAADGMEKNRLVVVSLKKK
ncbi:MAG: hypothetical protein AB7V36_03310 [Bacteroidales bacterium]|jgi:hypothetical protein|nr:hypothetical protein [Bacteroidales bacterium]